MDTGKSLKLKVHPVETGVTLIEFLSRRLGISRNKAKTIIDQRRVFVNGKRVWMARHNLKEGDQVTGSFNIEKTVKISRGIIIYEDDNYLVVNKPAGISSNGSNSFEQLLNRQSVNESAAACHAPRMACHAPRVACHRLDKDTTGCLIFAKSAEAKKRIIALFAGNKVKKKYESVVRGCLKKNTMTITTPIDGQKAITRIRLKKASKPACHSSGVASHLSITIETGRTHQIRKHLASIGHPVLGDQHYGVGRETPQSERLIGRQMLHAAEIEFTNPFSDLPVHVKAPMPADLKSCLRQYRLN